jgi:hypothetical protein
VIRITWRQLVEEPDTIAQQLAFLLGQAPPAAARSGTPAWACRRSAA